MISRNNLSSPPYERKKHPKLTHVLINSDVTVLDIRLQRGFPTTTSIHHPLFTFRDIWHISLKHHTKTMQSNNVQQTEERDGGTTVQPTNILEIPQGVKVLYGNMWNKHIHKSVIQSIILPESLEDIDDNAFSGFASLQSIHIPNGVRKIGEYAFFGCLQLRSVSLSQTLQQIKRMSFSNCKSLQSIDIPNGVTEIGNFAFRGCNQLQSVTLPQTLREIKEQCFYRCTLLRSINIPNGVTKIGMNAFCGCDQL